MTPPSADPIPAAVRPYQDNAECLSDLRQLGRLLLEQVAHGDGLPTSGSRNPLVGQAWAVLDARAAASRGARRFIPWVQLCVLFQLAREEQAVLAAAFAAGGSIPADPADLPGLGSWHLIVSPEPGAAAFPGGIRLDPVVTAYLQDQVVPRPRLDQPLEDLAPAPPLDALPVGADLVQRAERFLGLVTGSEPAVAGALLLAHGMDRPLLERLCAATFARLGLVPVHLDGSAVIEAAKSAGTRHARVARFRVLCRDLLLSGRAVVASNLQALGEADDGDGLLEDLLYTLLAGQKAIAVVNGPGRRLMDLAHRHANHRVVPVSLGVERPDAALRLRSWRDEARVLGFPLPEALAQPLAAVHPLTEEEIGLVLRDAAARRLMEPGLDVGELLAECCREQSRRTTLAVAEEIRPHFRLADIVLPRAGREALDEVLTHVRHRGRVFDEWGFSALSGEAGGGLCVLFHGPSGTGKTMAASIIANELGLGLYKIDLSSVFSKFIGETEKHLAQLFDQAEAMNVVLFFDEAESLFARRTETRDSHDRYANLQTGYLLQRIESYSGIVVLSTNLLQNVDKAFTRRFRFIVEFAFPGPAERSALWQKAFPRDAPRAPDIDVGRLADKLVLSGGNVNTVALSAAFLAASAGTPIAMAHVLKAAEAEYRKLGKVFRWDENAGGMDW